MPVLGRAKQRLGERLGSSATAGEGTQNLLCAYMAAGVLAGLLANTVVGWWWLDPVIALLIAGLAAKEGVAAWRGESVTAAPLMCGEPLPTRGKTCCMTARRRLPSPTGRGRASVSSGCSSKRRALRR